MVAELLALGSLLIAMIAELWHARRVARLAPLAFGPRRRPTLFGRMSPIVRVISAAATTWGLATLATIPPALHGTVEMKDSERHHLVLVLDVSPSMRLKDAGPSHEQTRLDRAADLLESFFARVPMAQFKISIIAVYNGAKPVVVDTIDGEVVWNILRDLPMHYAFPVGKTQLLDGLAEAAKIGHAWSPGTASLVFLSDGDTVPATGMPSLPVAYSSVVMVGVGDSRAGKFIDGRHSRQDVSTLRQVATRLNGYFHNGNEKQIPTDIAKSLGAPRTRSVWDRLTRREYALIAIGTGGFLYAFLPLLLHYGGSRWSPGTRRRGSSRNLLGGERRILATSALLERN